MKITELLTENAMLAFRDLTSLQVAILKRLVDGRLSADTASPREMQALEDLATLGLVDDLTFSLTQQGERVAELGRKYGSFERKTAAHRDAALGRKPFGARRGYTDNGDLDDVEIDDVDSLRLKNVRSAGALAGVRDRDDV